jgi:hypothetical protein
MHKIDGQGHINGQFTEGNPSTGLWPTMVTADWLNAVQAEIAAVIEGAGITLNKADNDQLNEAIIAMIAQRSVTSAFVNSALSALAAELRRHQTQMLEGKFLNSSSFDANYYQPAHGQVLNRADWPEAWLAIQTSGQLAADAAAKALNPTLWGRGDGLNTFEVKDLRSLFLRVDDPSDPRDLGTHQDHAMQRITGTLGTVLPTGANGNQYIADGAFSVLPQSYNTYSGAGAISKAIAFDSNTSPGAQTADETRPKNTNLLYVIRLK